MSEAMRKDHGKCPQCDRSLRKGRKFCSRLCWRKHFAERFDRFVSNPEEIALPQNFDEFLCKERLPCIVDGCDWIGLRLGQHVNMVHGITAEQLKDLAGFNKRSGLVAAPESRALSDRAAAMFADGVIGTAFTEWTNAVRRGDVERPVQAAGNRLEAKEHKQKALAVRRSVMVDKTCKRCGTAYQVSAMGHASKFCSVACRSAEASERGSSELICSFCGNHFIGNYGQVWRSRKGNRVACSDSCRQKMNIRAALAARGL